MSGTGNVDYNITRRRPDSPVELIISAEEDDLDEQLGLVEVKRFRFH